MTWAAVPPPGTPYQADCPHCYARTSFSRASDAVLDRALEELQSRPRRGPQHKKGCDFYSRVMVPTLSKIEIVADAPTHEDYLRQAHGTRRGTAVTITISGEGRSGRSSIAEMIALILTAHGIAVMDRTTDAMGPLQATHNLRRIASLITVTLIEAAPSVSAAAARCAEKLAKHF